MRRIYRIKKLLWETLDIKTGLEPANFNVSGKETNMNIAALTLVIIGAVNWLLIGLFQFDIVAAIFGGQAAVVSRIIYAIIGIAGLWALSFYPKLMHR